MEWVSIITLLLRGAEALGRWKQWRRTECMGIEVTVVVAGNEWFQKYSMYSVSNTKMYYIKQQHGALTVDLTS